MSSLRGAYIDEICTTNTRKGFQLLTYTHPANPLISPMSINKTVKCENRHTALC